MKSSRSIFFRNSYFVPILLILYSVIVWLPTRNLPYHWDSADFIVNAARKLQQTNFHPLIADYSDFAHPPLFPAMLALLWNIFGTNPLVSHLLTFSFLPTLLISTYLLGKKLLNKEIGLCAALILGTTPFVLAEYGQVYLDLPSAALAIVGLTMWFYKKYSSASIFFTLAALIKLPTLLLLIPLLYLTYTRKPLKKSNNRLYIWLAIPLLISSLWFLYHYQVTGWLYMRPGRMSVSVQNISAFWQSFKFVGYALLIHNGKWALGAVAIFTLTNLAIKKKNTVLKKLLNQSTFQVLIISLLIVIIFFSYIGEFSPRYGLFVYPLYLILSLLIVSKKFTKKQLYGISAGVILINVFFMHPASPSNDQWQFRHSEDLSYYDIISVHQVAAKFVEQLNVPVYGGFAENYQLAQPYQGYVNQTQNFTFCSEATLPLYPGSIIYLTPFHFTEMYCNDLIQGNDVRLVKAFNKNGYWIRLFQVNPQVKPTE